MNIQEGLLTLFSVISSLVIVLFVIFLGWYLVWKLFLSRFKLVRELLNGMNDSSPTHNPEQRQSKSAAKTKKLRKE